MTKRGKVLRHIDISIAQAKKHGQEACGDYVLSDRDGNNTFVVLCDGIGSGAYAHISAVMCANRILELMKAHIDLKTLGHKVAAFMIRARTADSFPFSAFSAVTLSLDGRFRSVTYENPEPVMAEHTTVLALKHTYSADSGEVIGLCSGTMEAGDTLFLMSDGITQAGMGQGFGFGWGREGFLRWANEQMQQKRNVRDLINGALEHVREMCGGGHKDDATLVALTARKSEVLNILSGPPENRVDDRKYVRDFLALDGKKVICGSTTADIFARAVGKPVETQLLSNSLSNPPKYKIEGIDLVTEGALTLSQVYNILDMDIKEYDEINTVTELSMLLKQADMVRFLVGNARNMGNEGLTFKQLGVLPRKIVIELIAKKLTDSGTQVNVTCY